MLPLTKFLSHFLLGRSLLIAIITFVYAVDSNAERRSDPVGKMSLFDGMKRGAIHAQFIPLGAHKANVLIRNLSDEPIDVWLPEAFAGVPILAQGFGAGADGLGQGGGGGGQALGGGGDGAGDAGLFRIAPRRVAKVSVATVCLEHDKPEPKPRMKYKIVPLAEVSKDPEIRLLCARLGSGAVTQNVAQAAAWHLMDGMSWHELANKNRVESKYRGNIRFFTSLEVDAATELVSDLRDTVKQESYPY